MKKGFLFFLLAVFVLGMVACDVSVTEMDVGGSGNSQGNQGQSASGKPSWEDVIGQLPQQEETVPPETEGVIVIRPTEKEDEPKSTLDYWIEYCDVMYLHSSDLFGLTQEEARIARNAIYAKSGRMFKDAGLNAYFGGYSWYNPRYSADTFSDSLLNDMQVHNLELVIEYEGRWK